MKAMKAESDKGNEDDEGDRVLKKERQVEGFLKGFPEGHPRNLGIAFSFFFKVVPSFHV